MNKIIAILAVFALSACSLQKSPVLNTTNISEIDFSNVENFSEGSDCAYYLLGLIGPFGDISVIEAIKDAEISKVNVVDYSSSYRGLYSNSCVNVYGE